MSRYYRAGMIFMISFIAIMFGFWLFYSFSDTVRSCRGRGGTYYLDGSCVKTTVTHENV